MDIKLDEYIHPDFDETKFTDASDAKFEEVKKDGIAPKNFHATTIYPEYFKIDGKWHLAKDSRMDCVPVWDGKQINVVEFRNLKVGDKVIVGRTEDTSEGIYVHADCWNYSEHSDAKDLFAFRSTRTRETSFSNDYNQLAKLLKYEKQNDGYVVWILGPAVSFDVDARNAMEKIINNGYCQALQAGNALATHDLEAAYMGTALGCNIRNQRSHKLGHYNHLETINDIKDSGSIKQFIQDKKIDNGIIYSLVQNNVPFCLTGSIRDDGPLPEVISDVYVGQNEMRNHIRRATTVIAMATVLHTIANGNMTPSYRVLDDGNIRPVYFYMVDTSEFAVNKLGDRGSLAAKGIVANVQDFMRNLTAKLEI